MQPLLLTPRLLFVLFSTLIIKIGILYFLKTTRIHNDHELIGEDETEFPRTFPVPELPNVRMFIEDTVHFQLEDGVEWDELTPGDGLVYLGDDHQPFTPSIFHQLRCLNIIRKAIVELEASGTNQTATPSDLSYHCVNYLRQLVLCRGDLEIDPVLGKPFPNVYPDTYQCKDWRLIYWEVEKNQNAHKTRL